MIIGQQQILRKTLSANGTLVIPAGHAISAGAFWQETANHAVTGGIRIGTTSGGQEVVADTATGALSIVDIRPSLVLKRLFSMSAPQTIFIQAASAWNGASIDIQIPVFELAGL